MKRPRSPNAKASSSNNTDPSSTDTTQPTASISSSDPPDAQIIIDHINLLRPFTPPLTENTIDHTIRSPSPPFPTDDSDLENILTELHKGDFFLGNRSLKDHVKWVESGRQHKLVVKQVNGDDSYEPTVLEWVGEISLMNFWLYPCAGWNGPKGPHNNWTNETPFEKAKACAMIRCTTNKLLAKDWKLCLDNVTHIMNTAKKNDGKITHSLIESGEIKIRHSIFEVRPMMIRNRL
jgi:hypothetical protein